MFDSLSFSDRVDPAQVDLAKEVPNTAYDPVALLGAGRLHECSAGSAMNLPVGFASSQE
jgi:hypothetical protein